MKSNKKVWKVMLAASLIILMAAVFTGCSSNSDTKQAANSSSASADDSLSKIKAKGKLVVGINAEFAPFEFHTMVDGKDTVAGFDVDLAKEVAKDMGVELELKELSFDALLTTLQSGQVDVVISGLSATEERRKTVDFSDSYFKGTQVVLTTKGNLDKFNTFSDLKDKKLGVQLSSLQEKLMQTLLPDGSNVCINFSCKEES
jgi:ABC-type amino acid transport substrate-binding protein